MRGSFRLVAGLVLVAVCADPAPTSTVGTQDLSPSLSRDGDDGDNDGRSGGRRFELALRARNEVVTPPNPPVTSISKGTAQLIVPANGKIRSTIEIDNRDAEIIRFCHIHWVGADVENPATVNGPIVWFLTPTGVAGTGVNLNLDTRFFTISQDADYVNSPFGLDNPTSEAAARTRLRRYPSEFYVNCHSNDFNGGFIRGNLPGHRSHRD